MTVRDDDIDEYGVVNNAIYACYIHRGIMRQKQRILVLRFHTLRCAHISHDFYFWIRFEMYQAVTWCYKRLEWEWTTWQPRAKPWLFQSWTSSISRLWGYIRYASFHINLLTLTVCSHWLKFREISYKFSNLFPGWWQVCRQDQACADQRRTNNSPPRNWEAARSWGIRAGKLLQHTHHNLVFNSWSIWLHCYSLSSSSWKRKEPLFSSTKTIVQLVYSQRYQPKHGRCSLAWKAKLRPFQKMEQNPKKTLLLYPNKTVLSWSNFYQSAQMYYRIRKSYTDESKFYIYKYRILQRH
jgi:hypothetical protein